MSIEKKIQEISKRILSDGTANEVHGHGEGSLPHVTKPVFARSAEETEKFVWNPLCTNNLALYVLRFAKEERRRRAKGEEPRRVAVIAKKCEVKAIVELIRENQIERDMVYVIGVPCSGMLSMRKIKDKLEGKEVLGIDVHGDTVNVSGRDFEVEIPRAEVLRDNCLVCEDPADLALVDEMIDEKDDFEKPYKEDSFDEVDEFEALPPKERWEKFKEEFENCIRCNACRNACPMCYCEVCFAESSQPRWLGASVKEKDVLFFQIMRVLHQAGRCVDCEACVAVCPMGLDIRKYTRKLNKEALEFFQFEAGTSTEDKALLSTFDAEDKQEFITEPE
jgi:ferredoxin